MIDVDPILIINPHLHQVTVKDPKGKAVALPRLKDNKDKTFSLEFVPSVEVQLLQLDTIHSSSLATRAPTVLKPRLTASPLTALP